jgi:adenylyl cyclase-associated protein
MCNTNNNIQNYTQEYREKNRRSTYFNHHSAISESIGALSWIAIRPAPASFVFEMSETAKFYTNRILRDFKDRSLKI